MRHRITGTTFVLASIGLLAGVLPGGAQSPTPAAGTPEVVGEATCADAEGFTCVTLRMPLDHLSDTGRTIDVTEVRYRRDAEGGVTVDRQLPMFTTEDDA